jgi:hypothetical protein
MELPRDGRAGRASDKRVRRKLFTYLGRSPCDDGNGENV